MVIGVVVLAGVISATLFTLFVVPVAYSVLARRSSLPGSIERRLSREMEITGSGKRKF
jgi:multidrug efflux pump